MWRFLPIAAIAGLLLLWVLWPTGETRQRVVVEKGVSLSENRNFELKTERMWKTPLTPAWKTLLLRVRKAGWRGRTNGPLSGVRSYKEQYKLWKCFRRGLCPPAFHPRGPSRHLHKNIDRWGQWSQAVDVSRPNGLVNRARRMGVPLWAPYQSEPWHIEALSVWSLPDRTKVRVEKKEKPLWPLLLIALAGVVIWKREALQDWASPQE